MPRLALLGALLLSLGLVGCESIATQSKPATPTASTPTSATPTANAPATAASVGTASTPASATPAGTTSIPAIASQAASDGDGLVSELKSLSGVQKFSIVAALFIFGLGYLLLQIHSAGSATGEWHPLAGFFGHIFTGGTAIAIRLFNNTLRFLLSGLTFTPLAPVSLRTGLPKVGSTYNPAPEPSPTTAASLAKTSPALSALLDPSVWSADSKTRVAPSTAIGSARSSSGVK